MIAILSPAKIQNFETLNQSLAYTLPQYMNEAEELVDQLRDFSISELASILKVNPKIASENSERFFNWHTPFTPHNAKQALFVYDGEAFRGLDATTMSQEVVDYTQKHLRIFSSLYGILRPLDLIQSYRLDQLSKFKPVGHQSLNHFWKEKMTEAIIQAFNESGEERVVLNLASNEYSKLLDRKKLAARIINFEFLQYQPNEDRYKQITFYTKKARGQMVRFIMENKVTNPDGLKLFGVDGYWYSEQLSKGDNLVFVR